MTRFALWLAQAGPTSFPELTWQIVLWLAQMPGTIPDLVWWALTVLLAVLLGIVGLVRRQDVRLLQLELAALRIELGARCASIEKDVKRLEAWQEDRTP